MVDFITNCTLMSLMLLQKILEISLAATRRKYVMMYNFSCLPATWTCKNTIYGSSLNKTRMTEYMLACS